MKKHKKSNTSLTKQIGGNHYKLPIQPIEFITTNGLSYLQGNVIKYIVRYNRKHSNKEKQLEDLKKARQYLDWIIESL